MLLDRSLVRSDQGDKSQHTPMARPNRQEVSASIWRRRQEVLLLSEPIKGRDVADDIGTVRLLPVVPVLPNHAFLAGIAVLGDQPIEVTLRGVALLRRCLLVGGQPCVNQC